MHCQYWLRFARSVFALCALAALFATGCARGYRHAPVDASRARETLTAALESWKKGDKVDTLQGEEPPIYVIDMDWSAGVKLKDYQIVDDGKEMDAHLFCPVKLTLQKPDGKEARTQVTYIVATAPNLTVARKVF
jgi:hypothetical protein